MDYKEIYRFGAGMTDWVDAHPDASEQEAKRILGGKGAALVKMTADGLPVPPGFTITTACCNHYRSLSPNDRKAYVEQLADTAMNRWIDLKDHFGYLPLVSVRSGAPISMPGMMDTILNVGLTSNRLAGWQDRLGPRAAADSRRRLIQMMGATAFGVNHLHFEKALVKARKAAKVETDAELDANALMALADEFNAIFEMEVEAKFPDSPISQLKAAIIAVFDSWDNPRAQTYRKMEGIDDAMGTAVTVQAMVFGNMGDTSGSGVLFTRHPSTGETTVMGEYLANAQGEDVVAGIRTPLSLKDVHDASCASNEAGEPAKWMDDLLHICDKLEASYRDMVDVEFTVQEGVLYILQSRSGKRSARAAIKIAMDMEAEGLITAQEAVRRVTAKQYKIASRPQIDPDFKTPPKWTGLPACPGVAVGKVALSSADAINCTEPCILVTEETTPEDIGGMAKAQGILTRTGGATSHAAVVARAMDKTCVVGCTDLNLPALHSGDTLTICGATGRVWVNVDVPVVDASEDPALLRYVKTCKAMFGHVPEGPLAPDEPGAYVIRSTEWWGDKDALELVLDDLAELETRDGIILDLTPPSDLLREPDMLLLQLQGDPDEFRFVAHTMLKQMHKALKGLTVLTTHALAPALREIGYKVPRTPEVMADVMAGDLIYPSPAFVTAVVGGDAAWEKLQTVLKQAGMPVETVPSASPEDYAVFKAQTLCVDL